MLPVRNDMPLPPKKKAGIEPKYPYAELSIGEYFFAPGATSNYPLAATGNKRHAPKRFEQRRIKINGVSGLGVWRVE